MDSFFSWVKSFVAQFLGKRLLERRSRDVPANTRITMSVLATDRTEYQVPPWSEFMDIINRAMDVSGSALGPQVIDTLRKKLNSNLQLNNQQAYRTVSIFRSLLKGKSRRHTAGTHCEAVLATLSQYNTALTGSGDLRLITACKVLVYIHSRDRFD
jgi:hypothetical protein